MILLFVLHLVASFSKSTLSALEVGNSGIEVAPTEIRPKDVAKIQFGISHLPKEEVADTLFATGADKQVGVGEGRR